MNDWHKIEVYGVTQMEVVRCEAELARRAGKETRANRLHLRRWFLIIALLVSLSGWWIL